MKTLAPIRILRVALAALALVAVVRVGVSAAQEAGTGPERGPRIRVAVMDITGSALAFRTDYRGGSRSTSFEIPPPEEFARGLTEMMKTALVETERFVVLERDELGNVLGEQEFGLSGRVNRETAPGAGVVVGAQYLVAGDITEFSFEESSIGARLSVLRSVRLSSDRVKAMVALDIRVLDAETGVVVFSKRVEGEVSAKGLNANVKIGDEEIGSSLSLDTPLGQASRQAIESAAAAVAQELANRPWSGRIVDVRDGTIYVNAGLDTGLSPGMTLDVYAQEEPLRDPETGLVLGTPDRRIGAIRVTEVADRYATAEAVEGAEFRRNLLVRVSGAPGRI